MYKNGVFAPIGAKISNLLLHRILCNQNKFNNVLIKFVYNL